MKGLGRWAIGAAAGFAVATVTMAAQAAGPLKIGFVYLGAPTDAGWTYQQDLGNKAMQKALDGKVKVTVVDNVPEGADAERIIRNLAVDGNRLIFTTSFGYMDQTLKVAKEFPNVYFEHATGYKRAKNVATYSGRFYEARYLTGVVAGLMTKTNVIGFVAAVPIPEVIQGIDSWTLGARSVNPKVKVKVIWVNEWYNPGKEREAAETLIAQGADVLTEHTDSTAVVQAAEEKGVWAVGYDSDMLKFGPHRELTSAITNWGGYYTQEAEAVLNGTWKSHDTWGGLASGMVGLAPWNPATPAKVIKVVEQRKADMIAGKVHVFQGPIWDNTGKLRIPAGQVMPDKEILGLLWYVKGVEGTVPH